MTKYIVTAVRRIRGHIAAKAGDIVYDRSGHDYGLAREDSMATGQPHISVTFNSDGSPPGFTIPIGYLVACDDITDLPTKTLKVLNGIKRARYRVAADIISLGLMRDKIVYQVPPEFGPPVAPGMIRVSTSNFFSDTGDGQTVLDVPLALLQLLPEEPITNKVIKGGVHAADIEQQQIDRADRNRIAEMAMQGLLSSLDQNHDWNDQAIAKSSFDIADAMIAERKKRDAQ